MEIEKSSFDPPFEISIKSIRKYQLDYDLPNIVY
jgi:hypothetical protein